MSSIFTYTTINDKVVVSNFENKILFSKNEFTKQSKELGFNIKSQLGGSSTLLNAGKTTNFIYKVNKISLSKRQYEEINRINTKSKIKERTEKLLELGTELEFQRMCNLNSVRAFNPSGHAPKG